MLLIAAALPVAAHAAAVGTAPSEGLRENLPRWHALTGARAVVAPGRVIRNATIIVRDGRIEAVGRGLDVPTGARRWDLSGKTVYAGFVEPAATVGLPADWLAPEPAPVPAAPPKPVPGTPVAGAVYWNPKVRAARDVAEVLGPAGDAVTALRDLGHGAALVVPQRGVVRGRSALVSLSQAAGANERIIADGVMQHAAFEHNAWPAREYPGSLMGAIALVRQALHDARWLAAADAAAARDPALARPETNAELAALAAVLDGRERLSVVARDELDYARIGALAEEFGIAVAIHGNGREYRRVAELAALDAPVVVPLAFPEAPEVERPERAAEITLEQLEHWEQAPSGPAALDAAGVPFSFTTFGLESPAEAFWPAVRLAVRRGLPADAALAALTTRPAELVGEPLRLGRIERGYIANLVVFDGDPFTEDGAKRLMSWVDGEPYPAPAWLRPDPAGRWEIAWEGVEGPATLVLERQDGKLAARFGDGEPFAARAERERLLLFPPGEALALADERVRLSAERVEGRLVGLGSAADGRLFRWTATPAGAPAAQDGETEPKAPREIPPLPRGYPAGAWRVDWSALPAPEALVVRGATVWTAGPDGVREEADLLVRGGRVVEVGRDLEAPRGALEIDGRGRHVTPGIIDAHSHTAIVGGVNEGTHAVTVEVRIGDVIDPTDVALYRQLAGGVTAANLLHGSANPMGGQNQVIKLRWGLGAEAMKLEGAPPGVKFALGENVKQSNWGDAFTTRYPQTRMGVGEIMRDTFVAAAEYREAWAAWRRERRGLPPRRDLRLEAALEILEGRRWVHIHSYRQDEILMFARLAAELGLKVGTFQHVLEGYKVADAIAEIGAGGSTFSDWWAYKFEVYDAIPHNAALMHRAGVVTSMNSDSNELARRLNLEAAKGVKYGGLTEEEALALVTINPARQLGIADRVGSLEPGKDADFVIWSGHPLSTLTIAEQTWIEGRRYFDREADRVLRAAAAAERERLLAAALAERLEDGAGAGPEAGGEDASPPGADPAPVRRPWWVRVTHAHEARGLYHDGTDAHSCALGGH